MSYQVLARKWRPRQFGEMAGQEHVLRALINALDHDRLHHAYLFTGTRGVGKTSVARILAKCLNCENGVSSTPCGECGACREITDGRFIDLIEVDAASRTKVEDTRELLENVQYAPTAGRFKVYLIDEVHMLSTHSFNALLKTLEEPPPHVKFLFATTDPRKLPVTVLSRCLQFNLKNLSAETIVKQLRFILGEEKIPAEEPALWSIARSADGSMRDALSLTDQAISHGGGKITDLEVSAMLGTIDHTTVIEMCQAVASGDGAQTLALVDRFAELAPDYSAALAAILSIWHRVAIAQTIPEALDVSDRDHGAILALAQALNPEDVQLFYQICLLGRRDLVMAADPRSGFEMVLLRQLAFQPVVADRSDPPEAAHNATEEAPTPSKKPEPAIAPESAVRVRENVDCAVPTPVPAPRHAPASEPLTQHIQRPAAPAPETTSARANDVRVALEALTPARWIEVCDNLDIGGVLQNVAANMTLLECQNAHLILRLDDGNGALYEQSHQQRLALALSEYFEQPVTVAVTIGNVERETPQAYHQRRAAERHAAAVQTLNTDPVVKELVSRFTGKLLEDTVVPLDENDPR